MLPSGGCNRFHSVLSCLCPVLDSSQPDSWNLEDPDHITLSILSPTSRSQPKALETADLLVREVFRLFGILEDIVLDRGLQFTSQVCRAFFSKLGVNVSLTSGYHPKVMAR